MISKMISIVFILIVLLVVSCSRSSGEQIRPDLIVDPILLTQSGFTGVAPFDFAYFFGIVNPDSIAKIEMDFGEGEGYIDVTDICLAYHRGTGDIPIHQYISTGTYQIKTRSTLKTGQVYKYESGIVVTVLPPDEGDGA